MKFIKGKFDEMFHLRPLIFRYRLNSFVFIFDLWVVFVLYLPNFEWRYFQSSLTSLSLGPFRIYLFLNVLWFLLPSSHAMFESGEDFF